MTAFSGVLGQPRTRPVTLSTGVTITIVELSVADVWPYISGGEAEVDPEQVIRASVIDPETGDPILGPDDKITMVVALELLPIILEFNNLEGKGKFVEAPQTPDFPSAVSNG